LFTVNQHLLEKAHDSLKGWENIYWLIGAACAGKSTISRVISEKYGITRYDMDTLIYGNNSSLYSAERHPAATTWLSASNPLDWQLSLSLAEFDAFNRAANVEYFDLFANDLHTNYAKQPLLVDGGITHPSLLVQLIPRERIFCIDTSRAERVNAWETAEARAPMKQWVFNLPNPQAKWEKFLAFDELIAQTIVAECRANNIARFVRDDQTSVDTLALRVTVYFDIEDTL
jgi:hypothetical protein